MSRYIILFLEFVIGDCFEYLCDVCFLCCSVFGVVDSRFVIILILFVLVDVDLNSEIDLFLQSDHLIFMHLNLHRVESRD